MHVLSIPSCNEIAMHIFIVTALTFGLSLEWSFYYVIGTFFFTASYLKCRRVWCVLIGRCATFYCFPKVFVVGEICIYRAGIFGVVRQSFLGDSEECFRCASRLWYSLL